MQLRVACFHFAAISEGFASIDSAAPLQRVPFILCTLSITRAPGIPERLELIFMAGHQTFAIAHALPASLTRRSFLKGALGSAVAAAAIGATACSGGEAASTSGSSPAVLKVGVENPKASFDTQTASLAWGASENICETLVELDPDTLEVKPVLLTKLPDVSDDGLTYSFELKDDIKFHDGSTMTTEDVEYSLTRLLAKKAEADSFVYIEGGQEVLDGTATTLSGFTATDSMHFTIRLKQVYSSFLNMLCQFYASIYPKAACEAAGDAWGQGTNFIGSGPYKLDSNDDSSEVVLKAFEDCHEGKPGLDEIDVYYIDDANTRMMNYKNGDIGLCFFSTSLLTQYEADSNVKDQIQMYMPGSTQFVNLNLNEPKLQDARARHSPSQSTARSSQTPCFPARPSPAVASSRPQSRTPTKAPMSSSTTPRRHVSSSPRQKSQIFPSRHRSGAPAKRSWSQSRTTGARLA